MKMNRLFLWVAIDVCVLTAHAQTRKISIDEIDSLVARRNLQLQAARIDVSDAEGQLQQAKKYANPELQVMHNVQNPINKKWFDFGYDGETDVQISQPIAIGGQHKNKVRQAQAMLNANKAAVNVAFTDAVYNARIAFADLYGVQQKLKVYDKEIASVEKILQAYKQLSSKGNESRIHTLRIATMLNELCSEKTEMQAAENDYQQQLHILLNIKGETPIETQMDEDAIVNKVIDNSLKLRPFVAHSDSTLLQHAIINHPELKQLAYQKESALYAVKAEKADALPHITLNGEWDKNGSIGHNFFAVGATVALPLWNRNQGNIRSAKAQYEKADIEQKQKESELTASFLATYNSLLNNLKLIETQKANIASELDNLIDAAEEQFMKRNISVIEFVDMYSSYRNSKFQMLDAKTQLIKQNEELNRFITN